MRILKLLIKNFFRLAVFLGLIFLGGREILLFLGKNQIKQSLTVLRRLDASQDYRRRCQEVDYLKGNLDPILQLRFLSDTKYVIEILCQPYATEAIVVDKQSLVWLVTKVPGQSGIVWGDQTSGITLSVLGRGTSVGVKNKTIDTMKVDEIAIIGPQSVCGGYGFVCCTPSAQIGEGEQLTGASDCPESCFSSCITRPVVLAFNTQPTADPATRTVNISAGEALTFAYTVSAKTDQVSIRIDYGDGQTEFMGTKTDVLSHTYECLQRECAYNVKLEVVDQTGVSAANLPINQLVVIVEGTP